ncbi:MAG TPA: hypothetical protein VF659_21640 [Pyrinomonadaceae bacterium]|jgi:hypothetical protein
MKKILGCFSAAFLAAFLAVTAQFTLVSAQQSSGGHPTPECEACAQACRDAFELCKLENGTSKSAFGKCAREQQQCGADCRKPGGACNPQADSGR